jgi:serine O-acetyltransferase
MLDRIREDIREVFNRDPAARNMLEVLLTYPGLHAIWMHLVSHWFYRKHLYTTARLISHIARFLTGIEIHPGATIGRRVFIDHGMGVVIGETAEVGDDCLIYKGVVLGGVSLKKEKRHPTLKTGVVVGSNAAVLGNITIGEHARIGSGSVVVEDVPPGATVVGIPGRVVKKQTTGDLEKDLEHSDLPDPMQDVVKGLLRILERYENRLQKLETEHGIKAQELMRDYEDKLKELGMEDKGGKHG